MKLRVEEVWQVKLKNRRIVVSKGKNEEDEIVFFTHIRRWVEKREIMTTEFVLSEEAFYALRDIMDRFPKVYTYDLNVEEWEDASVRDKA